MKRLIAGLLFTLAAAAQPTVSDISTVEKTHSTVTLRYKLSSVAPHMRVRYGLTTAYEGAGSFPDSGIQYYTEYHNNVYTDLVVRVSGLKPNTTFHFCPQACNALNSGCSACVDHTETTDAPPAVHPAYPIAPDPVTILARPDTSGYTPRAVAPNCSDLQEKIDAAAANLATAGSIITIPAGTVCSVTNTPVTLKAPPGRKKVMYSAVTTSTNRITIPNHGFSPNDYVKLAGQTPGSAGWDHFRQGRGFVDGGTAYVKVIDANTIQLSETSGGAAKPFTTSTFTVDPSTDTFRVPEEWNVLADGVGIFTVSSGTLPAPLAVDTAYYVVNRNAAAKTLQLSATPYGAAINITTAGSGTHSFADHGGEFYIIKWPATTNQIVIRTATPDSEFVPEGVRVTPEFAPKMAAIRLDQRYNGGWPTSLVAEPLAHNYRIEGIEFTHADTATAEVQTTINPHPFLGYIEMERSSGNIVFDRCYIHGLGYPNRLMRAIVSFNGANSAIINSYWENLDYWTPNRQGFAPTTTGAANVTIAAGTYYTGPATRTLASPVSATLSGASSGATTGLVYYSMSGNLVFHLPAGMSASCTGGASCTTVNSATPSYPANVDGMPAAAPIATVSLTNGAVTGVASVYLAPAFTVVTEGASSFIAGSVAGRTALINNYISSAGLPVHYDNGTVDSPNGNHYTIVRNHFITPIKHVANHPDSDHLVYGQRQQLEWKRGNFIRVKGNIFEGTYVSHTPVAVALTMGAVAGFDTSMNDIEVSSNIFRNGSGAISIHGGVAGSSVSWNQPPAPPPQRVWIHNNLIHGLNQYVYRATPVGVGYTASAAAIDIRGGLEDVRIEHNTYHDARGPYANFLFFGWQANEGLSVTDNIAWLNGGIFGTDMCTFNVPSCSGAGDGKPMLDVFGSGYTWRANSFIAGWTDESGATARTSKTHLTGPLTGLDHEAYLQSEMSGNIDWLSAGTGDFRIGTNASHKSGGAKRGSDGLDRGVDMDQLEREIGTIRLADPLNITSQSATIPFRAPDRGAACYVAYGAGSNPSSWAGRSAADTADAYARTITLPALSPITEYNYRVWCSGTAQSATGRFRTTAD